MSIIKDNRMVSDETFATRFVFFLKDIQVNDQMGQEELEYMRRIADSLLSHQKNTVTAKKEKEYLDKLSK